MARDVPKPVSTALTVLHVGLAQVRKLPETAAKVPVNAVGYALGAAEKARQAQHQVLVKVGLRSEEQPPAPAPVRKAEQKAQQTAQKAGERARKAVEKPAAKAEQAGTKAQQKVEKAGGKAEQARGKAEQTVAKAQQKTEQATPKQEASRAPKVDTAASSSNAQRAEDVAERVSSGSAAHDELPLPDFDHMTLGQLRGRLRKLSVSDLTTLLRYEKAHADRLPIVTMLDNRIAKVTAETETERSLPAEGSAAAS